MFCFVRMFCFVYTFELVLKGLLIVLTFFQEFRANPIVEESELLKSWRVGLGFHAAFAQKTLILTHGRIEIVMMCYHLAHEGCDLTPRQMFTA